MIDFRLAAKNSGQKAWLREQLPKLVAHRETHAGSKEMEAIAVEFQIHRDEHGTFWLQLIGGSTGYESADLVRLLTKTDATEWVACMGSDKYKRMTVSLDEIREAVREYNVTYRFEVL